jgi:hypothetical protein
LKLILSFFLKKGLSQNTSANVKMNRALMNGTRNSFVKIKPPITQHNTDIIKSNSTSPTSLSSSVNSSLSSSKNNNNKDSKVFSPNNNNDPILKEQKQKQSERQQRIQQQLEDDDDDDEEEIHDATDHNSSATDSPDEKILTL